MEAPHLSCRIPGCCCVHVEHVPENAAPCGALCTARVHPLFPPSDSHQGMTLCYFKKMILECSLFVIAQGKITETTICSLESNQIKAVKCIFHV